MRWASFLLVASAFDLPEPSLVVPLVRLGYNVGLEQLWLRGGADDASAPASNLSLSRVLLDSGSSNLIVRACHDAAGAAAAPPACYPATSATARASLSNASAARECARLLLDEASLASFSRCTEHDDALALARRADGAGAPRWAPRAPLLAARRLNASDAWLYPSWAFRDDAAAEQPGLGGVLGLGYFDARLTLRAEAGADDASARSNAVSSLEAEAAGAPSDPLLWALDVDDPASAADDGALAPAAPGALYLGGVPRARVAALAAAGAAVGWAEYHHAEQPLSDGYPQLELELFEPRVCGARLLSNWSRSWVAHVDTGAACLTLPREHFDVLRAWLPTPTRCGPPPADAGGRSARARFLCYFNASVADAAAGDDGRFPWLSFALAQDGPSVHLRLASLLLDETTADGELSLIHI